MKVKKIRILVVFLLFTAYFLLAARPVPLETVLTSAWVNSLENNVENNSSQTAVVSGQIIPFTLGNRFGYVDLSGQFIINRIKTGNIYLGENLWTEYGSQPLNIEINNHTGVSLVNIEDPRGYPILLDNRIFIFGSEQNELSEIDSNGNILWTYEYSAPITCIDAAAGLVLTGSLDGVIEILDSGGKRIFNFSPGGSKYEIILGCALSSNGSRLGIICGIDQQRFLFFERVGSGTSGEYRIVHHEFLETGFRRPVRILFIDEDRRIVYEREGGCSYYNIKSRRGFYIPLDGEITAIDDSGDQGIIFLITSDSKRHNELIGVKLPEDKRFLLYGNDTQNIIFLKASFYSDDVFLGRAGPKLIIGGGSALISFDLEDK